MDKTKKDAWSVKKDDLTPEALEKRKNINKKIYKFGCFPIILLAILIAIIPKNSSDNSTNEKDITSTTVENTKYINGIEPVDIYLNLEKQGFKTKKELGGEYGNMWTSTRNYDGIECRVVTFSSNINNVENVTATAMIDITSKKIVATKPFIKYIASLPYDNAKPEEAVKWVDDNFDNDKASIVIGDAKFIIYAPSVAVRMLTIEKAK